MSELTDSVEKMLLRRISMLEQRRGAFKVNPLTGEPVISPKDPYPPGATDAVLDAFVGRTGVQLPDDVRKWLKITNGAAGFFGVSPTQEGCSIEALWDLAPEFCSREWIPVGRDDFGNYFVRVTSDDTASGGGVCFVEGTSGDELLYIVASSTLHFAQFKLEEYFALSSGDEYDWPFDQDFVLSKDPELAKATIAPVAWEA